MGAAGCYSEGLVNDVLLVVVAALTFAVGVVLGVMVWRRREGLPAEGAPPREEGRAEPRALRPRGDRPRRPIDDFAIPVDFERAAPSADDEDDDTAPAGKICPRCGARYRSHSRVCAHDQSELASLN